MLKIAIFAGFKEYKRKNETQYIQNNTESDCCYHTLIMRAVLVQTD
jgi:hypothetical protein